MAGQNSEFKNSILLVNSNLIGILDRKSQSGAQYNYALRNNWGIADRLRGVLGSYYAEYYSSPGGPSAAADGTTGTPNNFVNLAAGSDSLSNYNHAQQVQSIPLTLTPLPSVNGGLKSKYLINLDNSAWNQLAFQSISTDLLRQDIEEPGEREGDPMWKFFLQDGFPQDVINSSNTHIDPIFNSAAEFVDLTQTYYKPSNNETIRAESGQVIKVEGVYNFYADTTPTYETISLQASEPMLPNFYCLESEIRNTGSTLNSQDYFNQITLNGKLQEVNIDNDAQPDPWFEQVAGPATGFTESKTAQFYTLYSKGLNIIKSNNHLDGLKAMFNEKYKNMVILNSDLAAMSEFVIRDDQTSGLRNMSFYNKITIGRDDNNVSDPSDMFNGSSFFSLMMGDPDFEDSQSFMDVLQLYIVQNILNGGTGGATTFRRRTITKQNATNPAAVSLSLNTLPVTLHFDMDVFLEDIQNSSRIEGIVDRINTNVTTADNFILIRNYNSETTLAAASTAATNSFLLLNEDKRINYPVQEFDKILENKGCYSEPVMYQIDKYVLPPSMEVPAAGQLPVQSFFIGKSFENKEINYIDSQVKYGVRYLYDIKQVRMVFGNKYSYKDLKVFFSAVAGYGRAVGNALGFYRETRQDVLLDDYVEEYVEEYISTDSDSRESVVMVGGNGTERSSLTGYYIFKASNFDAFVGGNARADFMSIFEEGTSFVNGNAAVNPAPPLATEVLRNIKIKIKEGFGLGGNESGGAHPGILDIAVPTVVSPPGEPLPGYNEEEDTGGPTPGAGAGTYGGAVNYGTPVPGTTAGSTLTQLGAPDPNLLELWQSGN